MSKRRRASSVASRQDDDVVDDSTPEQSPVLSTGRKRKKVDPSETCQQLYDSIRNIKKEDGTMLCDTFIRAPKRRQEPSYYDVVANPIDLLRVQQKLKTESYDDTEELAADFELLVNNAKAFYKSDTTEYQDACVLWETFIANKAKFVENSDEEPTKIRRAVRQSRRSAAESEDSRVDDDLDVYEELFSAVMTATDPVEDRALHTEFQLLPSKKVYPDYYDVIEHPIDLKLIATKIQTSAYTALSEMEKDLLQMTRNACTFNEPGSQIYKDAKTLKKLFIAKKIELESGKAKPSVKRRGLSFSATTAALKEEPESSDDENDGDRKPCDGPMWQLFDYLFNAANASDHPNATGAPLGQSLWKLPIRRFHPEYYELIKKPMSMSQIQKKLKRGEYANITDLTADLYLMIDNAKKAFPQTHRAHKDGQKMLKIMNAKLIDVPDEQDESDSEEEEEEDARPGMSKKKGRARAPPVLQPQIPVAPANSLTSLGSPKAIRIPINLAIKKKLLNLQKFLTDYSIDGRKPMLLFMEKPSKKLYPDYYNVIQHPIDMNTIENNIRNDRYSTVEEIVADYRLMFTNCRQYNEERSTIYEDADKLEKALNEKLKELTGYADKKTPFKALKTNRKTLTPLEGKLWQLYEAIRDYHEPKGNRQLSLIFMKLPSKNDYPDYYHIIKNPIDMERIAQKLRQTLYDSVDEMAADFLLMLENACKYNEPDSQIYKDALVLQQLCIQTKQFLRDSEETVPDVQLAVQELILSLFTSLYNHQDEEGRCFSDSLAELPEYDELDQSTKVRGISLDLIKRRLDKGLYKRLDVFQEDLFSCLDRARKLSRTDSQVFEDAIELQAFFIKKRDELCKDILSSPALSYSALHLSAAVEAVRQSKLLQEEQEQEDIETAATQGESMTIDEIVYSPGDFVFYDEPESKLKLTHNLVPGIAYIERLWTNTEGVKMMYANLFMRPFETYHLTSRKFLEMEVFKSDQHQAMPLSRVLNKCYVMSVRDYIKFKPESFADKDVFVCESRYNVRARSFKKIKIWPFVREKDLVKFIPRETVIEPKRIMSVFMERVEKHKGELAELQLQEALAEKEKPNIVLLVKNGEVGCVYYEQYNTVCSGVVKIGDYVYVATQYGKQSIAQIHSIWETSSGKSFFQGPWLLTPSEIPSSLNKHYYRQELLLSTVYDTNPVIAIVGRCAVQDYSEYTTCRPTEIPEADVYVCEATYDELKKQIRRFAQNSSLKKFTHSQMVTPDEIFHFKRCIKPFKVAVSETSSLDTLKAPAFILDVSKDLKTEETLGLLDDSLDGASPSINSDNPATSSPVPSVASTPISKKDKLKQKSKLVTGYILYSSEVRKGVIDKNPEANFGEISRTIGTEWKNLPGHVKQVYEDKAIKCNQDKNMLNKPFQVYECHWNRCDYQFEDSSDCLEHCINEETGHVATFYTNLNTTGVEYNCMWRSCIRMRKNLPPFPHLRRLIKHVHDVHLTRCQKTVLPHDRSKNYIFRKNPIVVVPKTPQPAAIIPPESPSLPTLTPPSAAPTPPEPMFVTVPPRPQRVLHSEAYIRYIEGLQKSTPSVSSWEKTLRVTQETAPKIEPSRLPAQWLGEKVKDKPDEIVNALWHLRNFMMQDVTQIRRNLF